MNVVLVSGMTSDDFDAVLSKLVAGATNDPDININLVAGSYDHIDIELFDSTAGMTYTGATALYMLIKSKLQKGK